MAVVGGDTRGNLVQAASNESCSPGPRALPLAPEQTAQAPTEPLVQLLKACSHVRHPKIRHPTPDHRSKFLDNTVELSSNVSSQLCSSCSVLYRCALRFSMTSADFCSSIATLLSVASPVADKQISQGKARDFTPIYPVHIRPVGPDGIGLRVFWPSRPPTSRLVCTSCSPGQEFAYSFLPTPPRGDAVAVRLGVPAIKVPRGLPSFKGHLLVTSRFAFAPRLTAPSMALPIIQTNAPDVINTSNTVLTCPPCCNGGGECRRFQAYLLQKPCRVRRGAENTGNRSPGARGVYPMD